MLSIVEHFRAQNVSPKLGFLYLGRKDSLEESLCKHYGLPFRRIWAAPLRGTLPVTFAWNSIRLLVGIVQSLVAMTAFRPDATLATGGYASAPVIIAGWVLRCPVLIFLPDIEPGLAVEKLARFATRVAISFPETAAHLPAAKCTVTGYPVRLGFHQTNKEQARLQLGLSYEVPVVLALGGSQAAHAINVAIAEHLYALTERAQLIHICGKRDYEWLEEERNKLPEDLRERYRLHSYLHEELIEAMASADLAISRAGAATLGEFPAVGLPAILIPYPYSGQHQERNADYLVAHGAALKIHNDRLHEELLPAVIALLNNPSRLREMSQSARQMSRPDAVVNIAALLREIAADTHHPAKSAHARGGSNGTHRD